jgi:hypothetical protein
MKRTYTPEECQRRIEHWRWMATQLGDDMQWLARNVIAMFERKIAARQAARKGGQP